MKPASEGRKSLLLSIKPKFVNAIFEGAKLYELRRRRPLVAPNTLAIIYCSSPNKAIVGSFNVNAIIEKPLDELWKEIRGKAAVNQDEFLTYYEGLERGVALSITSVARWKREIGLNELRHMWPEFHPPQSYRFMADAEFNALEKRSR